MKKVGLLIIIIALCGIFAFAQSPALPANIAKMNGEDSDELLNHPIIKTRLDKLLGKKSLSEFMEGFETITPIKRDGNFLFAKGCMIHACGHIESAIAIDLANKTIHVGIFRETEKTKYFNEKRRRTPQIIKNWINHLTVK